MNGEHKKPVELPSEDPMSGVYSPQAIAWAEKECTTVLAMIRENYSPSEPIENIIVAAFLHGAACAFKMDSELGDVATPKDIANG